MIKKNCYKFSAILMAAALLLSACGGGAGTRAAVAPESKAAETAAAQTAAAESVKETAAEAKPESSAAAAKEETKVPETTAAAAAAKTETSAAVTTAETTAAETTAAAAEAGPEPVAYEFSRYVRDYPGTIWDKTLFTADAVLIHITSDGYEGLKASLEEQNTAWKDQADAAFANQAKEFASGEVNEFLMDLTPFESEAWVNIFRADSNVFSFAETNYGWYGGAHPYSYQLGFSYDSASGKRLELKDAVTDYDAFYEEVRKALSEHEYREGFFPEWEDTLKAEFYDDPELSPNWMITPEGISVWFNQYEIAPYAAGPIYLDFPKEKFGKLLHAEYFPESVPEVKDAGGSPHDGAVHVYDLINEHGTLGEPDEYGWAPEYRFRLPEIDGPETDYIKEINAEIAKLKADHIDSQLEMIKQGQEPVIYNADFTEVQWQGITSVRLSIDTPSAEQLFYCWNIREDGQKAENEELLKLFDLTPESFTEQAEAQLQIMTDWELAGFDEGMAGELKKMREQTLSAENVNADMPLFITPGRGLGFIGGIYTPAGSGYVEGEYWIPDTEHRLDGLTQIDINPMYAENFEKKSDHYMIRDSSGKSYRLDNETVLIGGIPCYDDGCDAMTWLERYLSHPAAGEFSESDPYAAGGFAMGDVWTILVDADDHISVVQMIGYWD